MGIRRLRAWAGMVAVALVASVALAAPGAASADEVMGPGVFAVHTGQVESAGDTSTVALEVSPDDFAVSHRGTVGLSIVAHPEPGSELDPRAVDVEPRDGTRSPSSGPRRDRTGDSRSSLALAELEFGSYDLVVRGAKGTVGAYRLELRLTGDVNGDLVVDDADLDQIESLEGVKERDDHYDPIADVDGNGVVNRGDRQRAGRNLGAGTSLRLELHHPTDEILDEHALALAGVSPDTFNPVGAPLEFTLDGTAFHDDLDEIVLTVNGSTVPATSVALTRHTLTVSEVLVDGRNDVSLSAVDEIGRPLHHSTTLWAGSRTMRVDLVDADGQPFTEPAAVVASLSDDQSVSVAGETATGSLTVTNVPVRTIHIEASAGENLSGFTGVIGSQSIARIRMLGFGEPSPIDNNDFSLGTDGWDIGDAPVAIIPHVEGVPQPFGAGTSGGDVAGAADLSAADMSTTATDNDLLLSTQGEGEQSISRTFQTEEGTSSVRVRYRFVTSEVPGGWFGSQYNDYFRVSLRSQGGGGFSGEHNSMNGLGLAAFDFASGATDWRDVTLPVDSDGDVVQVDVGVANVGDGLFDSHVVVDFVEEVRDQVRPSLAWNTTQGGMNLTYTVEDGDLETATTIDVHWAGGTGYADRIGGAIFSHVVPAGTPEGQHGPVHIAGGLLADDPDGVTHLLAASSPTSVGPLADVRVDFGANANRDVVWQEMIDIIKDGLRAAGQANATITSTARTPEDQARAMFQNLVNPANPVDVNVTNQRNLYAAPGRAVVDRFVAETQGMTREQIVANQAAVRAAMVDEIQNQGCQRVSRHCADPDETSVVDVGAGAFNATNGPLFVAAVQGRVSRFIDERATNNCYHLELQ